MQAQRILYDPLALRPPPSSLLLYYWLLTTGYWLLATGYWLLATHYSLLTTHYSLLHYSLLAPHYSLLGGGARGTASSADYRRSGGGGDPIRSRTLLRGTGEHQLLRARVRIRRSEAEGSYAAQVRTSEVRST